MLVIGLVCLTFNVDTAAAEAQKESGMVKKRLELAESYLNSKTASKISEGNSEEARQFLARAHQFLDQARKDLETGNLDQAAENADQSIRAFTAAGAANAKSGKSSEQSTVDNTAIRTEIDGYLQSFRDALAEKGPAMAGLLDQQQVADLLAQAEKLKANGDQQSSTTVLNQAKQLVVAALTKIRSNETVVYALEFQTPADEYRYETERYQEYVNLSQKVLDNSELEESRKIMFDQLKGKSEQFNQQASDLAGKGDYEAAIAQMEEALKKMVQALQLLGVQLSL
jgi:HEPN domain-containing protein